MQVISRGTTVSATSAEQLVFFGVSGGWLTDVFALEFQIWRGAAQVFPATIGQRQSVDIVNDRLGKGRYAASWLVPSDATTGAYEVRWFYQLTSGGPELRATTRFEVVTTPTAGTFYAGPSDLAAEGADIAEARALEVLALAGEMLERFTRTFFEPRYMVLDVDGRGGSVLHLRHPVSALERVAAPDEVSASSIAVYNRHLRGEPLDARNPKLERKSGRWPKGPLAVSLTGVFGSLVPGAPWGDPHPLARRAVMMIAIREAALLASPEREDAVTRHRILSESTRDQSYTRSGPGAASGQGAGPAYFTGDPEIDQIIVALRGPIHVAGV